MTLTSYDQLCGFNTSKDAIAVRRAEDHEAMSVLHAKAVHLDFAGSQYGVRLDASEVVKELRKLINKLDPELVVAPLGLIHPDHEAVRDALLEATADQNNPPVWLYEDLPARVQPEVVPKVIHNRAKRG